MRAWLTVPVVLGLLSGCGRNGLDAPFDDAGEGVAGATGQGGGSGASARGGQAGTSSGGSAGTSAPGGRGGGGSAGTSAPGGRGGAGGIAGTSAPGGRGGAGGIAGTSAPGGRGGAGGIAGTSAPGGRGGAGGIAGTSAPGGRGGAGGIAGTSAPGGRGGAGGIAVPPGPGGHGGHGGEAGREMPVPACIPGQSAACACTDGSRGAQVCRSDGTFDPCVCVDTEFERIVKGIVGTWRGTDTSPWSPTFNVQITFGSDGVYTGHCADTTCPSPVFYYGTDDDSPLKIYKLMDLHADGTAVGSIMIFFGPNDTLQDTLDEVSLSRDGQKLTFTYMHSLMYGPIVFDLTRVN